MIFFFLLFFLSLSIRAEFLKRFCSTTVTGIYGGIDPQQEKLLISQLQTPLYLYPEGLVRVTDVLSVKFPERSPTEMK